MDISKLKHKLCQAEFWCVWMMNKSSNIFSWVTVEAWKRHSKVIVHFSSSKSFERTDKKVWILLFCSILEKNIVT